jgi:DNA ligase-1
MLLEQLIGSLQGAPQLRLSPLIVADSWEHWRRSATSRVSAAWKA